MPTRGYIIDDRGLRRLHDMQARLKSVEARRARRGSRHRVFGGSGESIGTLQEQVHKMVTDNVAGWGWLLNHALEE